MISVVVGIEQRRRVNAERTGPLRKKVGRKKGYDQLCRREEEMDEEVEGTNLFMISSKISAVIPSRGCREMKIRTRTKLMATDIEVTSSPDRFPSL